MLARDGWLRPDEPSLGRIRRRRTCVLAPDAGTDPTRAVELATRSLKSSSQQVDFFNNMALAHLRAGQDDKAIARARGCLYRTPDATLRSLNWLILALAEQRRGHSKDARQWFDKADAWIGTESRRLPQESAPKPGWNWVEVQLLHREAQAAVADKK